MHPILKVLYHIAMGAIGKKSYRFPMGVYIYLTFRCNLRCSYCDGGSGEKFPLMKRSELSIEQWRSIFTTLHKHTDFLLLSGGEPLMYEKIIDILRVARETGFKFISLNTNGLLLTPEVIEAVDAIIISLDSLDREKSDRLWNREGATDRVLKVLVELAQRRNPSIMVNSVILNENIDDVADVMEFCGKHGITFSAGPALDKVRPIPGLKGNRRYHALIDKILKAKRAGYRIAATIDYLRAVKHFQPFDCHPLLVWRVYPDGNLLFPCSRMNSTAGNLLETPDPIALFKKASGGEYFEINCGENCPLSCYMDTSHMIHRPLGLLREGLYRMHTFSQGHRLVY